MTQKQYPPLASYRSKLLSLRDQADIRNAWLKERLETVIPAVLERAGVDMWVVIAREYNEDPVIMTLLPAPSMAARRRTILVFARRKDGGVDRLTLSRYGMPSYYEHGWNPEQEEQFACLARVIKEYDPQKIALNVSDTFAFADGLSHGEFEHVRGALGADWMARVVPADAVAVGWLETRIPAEMEVYPSLVELGHAIIAEGFSSRVITPNITTTVDLVWWFRQTMQEFGLQAWFQPSVELQASGEGFHPLQYKDEMRKVIMTGDLLHCDVGFYYLGLATDQQQHAYVLRRGETAPPSGLNDALKQGNRLQDIVNANLLIGRTGNQVLQAALDQARAEGLRPQIYCHPIGYHGHAAGPTIGLWDQQDGVKGTGDYPIYDNTAYSNELNVLVDVPEWGGQTVRIALEEDILLRDGSVTWLDGRQESYHII